MSRRPAVRDVRVLLQKIHSHEVKLPESGQPVTIKVTLRPNLNHEITNFEQLLQSKRSSLTID